MKHDQLRQELCFREHACVAVNEHHRFAKEPHIELLDLAGEPMLTLILANSTFSRYLVQCCIDAGFQPAIYQEATEPQTLLAMVGAGLGVAMLPALFIHFVAMVWPWPCIVPKFRQN